MRIDAHQHFWSYNPQDYGWITDQLVDIRRDFMPDDLKPLLDQVGFEGCVAVQARQSLEESRFLLDLADKNDFICGVVGWVDLCSPDLPSQLERLAQNPKLVGVRHIVQDEPDDAFLLRPDFQRGIACLGEFALTYDVLIFPRQLPAAIKFVEAFPQQSFVLDHIAKPPIADGILAPWEKGVRELAKLPNIHCKLSGMVTEASWKVAKPEDFRPYLDVIFEVFSSERLMIGSDWPVCTLSTDYATTLGIIFDYIQQCSPGEQEGILGTNCARFYQLDGSVRRRRPA